MPSILCINASDPLGHTGLQADIRTIRDLGAQALTAVTAVTAQNHTGIVDSLDLPTSLVAGQIRAIYDEARPHAVKVGMLNSPETIRMVRDEIVGCPRVVCSPVILSSQGGCLMSNDAIRAFRRHLLPLSTLLLLKCTDAEILLGRSISNDTEMAEAASELMQLGARWVLLRGGTYMQGRINALLMGEHYRQFFSSVNIEGWQRHGVGGALSTAIAVRLAQGDEVPAAVKTAHDYIHSQVVYAAPASVSNLRPHELYDRFLSLVAGHFRTSHDVAFYAQRLAITPRYLSQITHTIADRTPKQIIDSHLVQEAEQLLSGSTQTIQEISNQLGFSSQITFSKFFKAKKGISPSGSRETHAPI